ncbi:BMP family protein [Erysipelotrichaceae bacterium OttesenSCG-928-M19]|nr:BMP family protein [Erysipelotrichaceae bacterium OttesenSCG-928-M19]
MKKLLGVAAALALVLGVSACGGTSEAVDCTAKIAIVTDKTGVNDKSFNQGAYEGLKKFEAEFKDQGACLAEPLQSGAAAEYVSNLTTLSGKDNQLVLAAGFTFAEPMDEVQKNFPDQKFLIIDTELKGENVVSADFAANEGSFLAGVAAAEKAKAEGKDKVGFVGGMKSPVITGFEVGYVEGVKAVDKNMKIDVKYVGSFDDATKAKTIANQMYSDGAYVVFVAAGGAGNGVINSAKELVGDQGKDVWVIGVDRDQYEDGIYDGDKSVILTSMVKRADVAAYDVAKSILDGTFKGNQTLKYDLKDGGVGLPDENPNLNEDIMKVVNEYKDKIINGEITVPSE